MHFSLLKKLLVASLLVGVVFAVLSVFKTANIAADTTVVSDTFTRSVSSGWGSADTGGSYTITGTSSDFNVSGTEGTISNPSASSARIAVLSGTSVVNSDVTFKVKTDKVAAGSAQEIFLIAREIDSSNHYRAKVRLTTTNTVTLQSGKLVGGVETLLGSQNTVSGLVYAADSYINIRVTVTGTSPTTIEIKAWLDGDAEPGSWTHTATDSEAALQLSGYSGLRTNLPGSTSNAPVMFTFDDFAISTSDVLPTPTPTPTAEPQTGDVLLSDTFTRSSSNSWGSPTVGGAYVINQGNAADFDVNGSEGTITSVTFSTSHTITEQDSSQQDIDFQFKVKTDKIPTGGAAEIFLLGRRVDASNEYRGKVRLTTSNTVTVQATKYVNGTETALGSQTAVSGLSVVADSYIYIRTQVTGTSPTTIRMKAWDANGSEPASWTYTTTDSESVLQADGAVGLRTNLPSAVSNAPIVLSFDDINATTQDGEINSPQAPAQEGTTIATDTFTRSVSDGWGSASTGGAYSVISGANSNFSVSGSEGTMLAGSAGVTRAVSLNSVYNQDVDIKFKVKLDKVPTGAAAEVFWTARRLDSSNQYRGKVRFTTSNTITIQATNVISGTETLLGNQVTTGVSYSADEYVYIRSRVVGTHPTTIYMKAWLASGTEPADWQYSVEDYEVQYLQTSGSLGLRINVPGGVSNTPIVVTFDDLNATSTDIDSPTIDTNPTPTPVAPGATVVTATIDLDGTPTVSKLNVGVSHIQESANSGGNAAAIQNAKNLLEVVTNFQNQHIIGFGVSNLWDDPSKDVEDWNWTALDNRVKLMRDTNSNPILTLCCAPTWMVDSDWSPGNYNGSNTDWGQLEEAPLVDHEDDFAYMVQQIVERYDGETLDDTSTAFPNILYYQVWNEMKGMWYTTGNRWDHDRYNRLYGLVYDAIKSVRPEASVGGPYVRMAAYLNPNGVQDSAVNSPNYGTIDQRNLNVVSEWLSWLDANPDGEGDPKAQFIVVDGGVHPKDVVDGTFPTNIFAATEIFADVNSFLNSEMSSVLGLQLPIWWAEDYVGKVNGAPVLITSETMQPPALATLLYQHLYAGTTMSLRWGPEEQISTSGVAQGNKQNLYSSTQFSGGGQPYDNYYVYKNYHDYFGPGTSVYPVDISPTNDDLTVLASSSKVMLINKGDQGITVTLQQSSATSEVAIPAYEVILVDMPSSEESPAPSENGDQGSSSGGGSGSGASDGLGPMTECYSTKPGIIAPRLYAALNKSATQVEIFFTEGDAPFDSYVVEYGTASGNYEYSAIGISKNTRQFTIGALVPGRTYYFRIRTANGCATGPWSNEFSNRNTLNTVVTAVRSIIPQNSRPIPAANTGLQFNPTAAPQPINSPKLIDPTITNFSQPSVPVQPEEQESIITKVINFFKKILLNK